MLTQTEYDEMMTLEIRGQIEVYQMIAINRGDYTLKEYLEDRRLSF